MAEPDPELDGLWTADVCQAWLESLGVPHVPRVSLYRGPRWPKGVDRCGVVTITPGARGTGEFNEPDDSWPGFQLAFRGRQRTDADRDAELLSRVAHRRILRAARALPVWVPSGAGRVRLLEVVRSGAGPTRIGPEPDSGERTTWTATYLTHVIEEQ